MKIALVVHANPFAALDHEGRAACAVYYPGTASVVGGAFDYEAHEASKAESASGEGKHRFTFTDAPVSIECGSISEFAYFRRQVLDGALIAGDEATAKKCGVKFADPKAALEAAHDKAVADFRANYGVEPKCVARRHQTSADAFIAATKPTKSAAQPAAKE